MQTMNALQTVQVAPTQVGPLMCVNLGPSAVSCISGGMGNMMLYQSPYPSPAPSPQSEAPATIQAPGPVVAVPLMALPALNSSGGGPLAAFAAPAAMATVAATESPQTPTQEHPTSRTESNPKTPTAAQAAAATEQRFKGIIKNYDEERGYGFVSCRSLYQRHKRDVFIHKNQWGTLQVGDAVEFTVELNKSGQPQAREVRRVCRPNARSRRARASRRGPPKLVEDESPIRGEDEEEE
eukprot:Hpha_TRINITY_DN10009_c0_g1::TRINITY_DN10009_c0_g1_i1::g.84039::m.84039